MISSRRYDLDWLRLVAFGILIYFHTAILFIPGGLPLIQNKEISFVLTEFVEISSQFRLSLLFFISGVGVAFARRRRTTAEFVKERSQRLLIPLVVGIPLIVAPMVYTEKLFLGEYEGSIFSWYDSFFTEGVYPSGNLSWHHFWFIAYLYLFCLIGLRLFPWLEKNNEQRLKRWSSSLEGYWLFLPILPIVVIELFLRPIFPGFRDLISDWASFSHWFVVFVCGYLVAHRESLLDSALKLRYLSLAGFVLSILFLYCVFGAIEFPVDMGDPYIAYKYMVYSCVKGLLIWSAILACLGFAGRYLRINSPALSYLSEAVYPLFIWHLLVIVVLGYWVVNWDIGLWTKFWLISNLTLALCLMIYHFAIRPFNFMRLIFGVKPKH